MDDDFSLGMAPVVVFAFNRPEKLLKCLNKLSNCSGAACTDVYVVIDGPRNLGDVDQVKSCSDVARRFKNRFARLDIQQRATNLGLARSILLGVSTRLEQYNKVIVLEDDLIVQGDFLQYMNEALNVFEFQRNIGSISAYGPFIGEHSSEVVYLNKRSSSWGWATWQDRWERVDWDITLDPYKNVSTFINCLLSGQDLFRMMRAFNKGKISSWSVRFTYFHWIQGLYCVYPYNSRVHNIGFSTEGTNTKMDNCHMLKLSQEYKDMIDANNLKFSLRKQIVFSLYYSFFFRLFCRLRNIYVK